MTSTEFLGRADDVTVHAVGGRIELRSASGAVGFLPSAVRDLRKLLDDAGAAADRQIDRAARARRAA